jgi:photosystem II stability/assembly factor-like uncharacterized protein
MTHRSRTPLLVLLMLGALVVGPMLGHAATDEAAEDTEPLYAASTYSGLELREIGPALASGRVGHIAVDPTDHDRWFIAVASGGVWRTDNAGITWEPVFDDEGSYSIGCVTIDPHNPHVVWVGTGENNSQRSVSFGDGIYRSRDGGTSWESMGLKDSEHIARILIDPRDSNTIYVAAQGPLWNAGGDRGLYRSTDGGETWELSLEISEHTGVTDVVMDPRNPDVLIAASYQRRRHVWTLINGGPESAIYKSTDAGASWRKVTTGLPKVDLGRIGLAMSPADPDVVYAIVEAAQDEGGFFRSTDLGETWTKRSDHMSSSPQYYNEIVCDPADVDRVYSLSTYLHVTTDGGATFERVPRENRHVDDHALWIDPEDPTHMVVGCDGGVYDTFDRGQNWRYMPNLPITQFYRVTVDTTEPFYLVYGGTQDNNTVGGPSRTRNPAGILNEDWFVTVGGDGFEPQVDPEDPHIVYSQWQYGGLVRHDRRSGETVDIKPREAPGEAPYTFNWDSPLLISPHDHTRLYFAAQKLFRSDDRGNSWTAVSDDLTRQLDRNSLEVMGRVWSVDAVSKNRSTSFYGNIVSLTESPLVEGLLYAGTDDGLIHVTSDGGDSWTKIDGIDGVPKLAYVSDLEASRHDADTVYASFDNHKMGDFKPYVYRSTDRGASWTKIVEGFPESHTVWSLAEDHVDADLLFAGTEYGVLFTQNGGDNWTQLTGGIPTIAVRDVEIQRRESDLVLATFGRGFWILDDYSPLREVSAETLEESSKLFPVKDAWRYIETSRLGRGGLGSQGASFYAADNPPYGAVFTYWLADTITTRAERRREAEKAAREAGEPIPYPSWEALRAEDMEPEPEVVLTVRDATGAVVRRLVGPRTEGFHRVAWDLRYPAKTPVDLESDADDRDEGVLAAPGSYTVTLATRVDGVLSEESAPQELTVVPLKLATFAAEDREAVLAFQKQVAELRRAVHGALRAARAASNRLDHIEQAILDTPEAEADMLAKVIDLRTRLEEALIELRGDETVEQRYAPTPPSIIARVELIARDQWNVTSAPTDTQRDGYRYAASELAPVLDDLRTLIDTDLTDLEQQLEAAGAPWTPGRALPTWSAPEVVE